ncbi:RecQ family ATP-dependent DNA helicase [Ancylothrix sp. C2]|uniref:RecQ family ATP-dependent DNA helicase n=1 Tax=Ancylothrix sp. D3o TaxID=2953691 RepID=UPI0021BA5158|nr:RecQ family ATP-dependent DNA helicase [Ancylothrix sp. D3o]MCT7953218.1 RecQ family ATP-dependent DNA helicase [Ancylothrix sp. D3o]
MTEGNLEELAKASNAEVIDALLKQLLEPLGVTARTILNDEYLQVMLESAEVPVQQKMVDLIIACLRETGRDSLRTVKIYGKKSQTFDLAWRQEIEIAQQANLDDAYLYLDLEVNGDGEIFKLGWIYLAEEVCQDNVELGLSQLVELKEVGLQICGHNFRRFDCLYLIKKLPQLSSWLVVDTLELSVLTYPLDASHKLKKAHKKSSFALNNPLEDARETKDLLQKIIEKWAEFPPILRDVYIWLLSCGEENADNAYEQFFTFLRWVVKEAPNCKNLPPLVISGLDWDYLEIFWKQAQLKTFNERLCLAGILAANYESNCKNIERSFSGWLAHLAEFQEIWEGLEILPNYQTCLQQFGLENFRGKQEEAVRAILHNQNPLVIMATGAGKSLCYQVVALLLFQRQAALTVVISPLQALMADQVADLEEMGVNFATFINGNLQVKDRQERLKQLRDGAKGLLYISPEQLRSPSIRALLEDQKPSLWVIDEAHCISQWGHSFRPDYRYIPKYIHELYENQSPPLLALMTATATVKVQEDIKELFKNDGGLEIKQVITETSIRENLQYKVVPVSSKNKEAILLNEVKQSLGQGGCVLIYTTTRKNAEKVSTLLNQEHIDARYYHGKMQNVEKEEVLQAFKTGELNVIAATCAFGMGINRKDVRAVIHHAMSPNLEAYIQETGRAGRDGMPADCTLLFNEQDADILFYLQSQVELTEAELRNIFIAIRSIRDRIHGGASPDWFWVTLSEMYQNSDLEGEFANDAEYRDIKIKVALQYLENCGLIERAESLSAYVQFELTDYLYEESARKFVEYAQFKNLSRTQIKQFKKLIMAMYSAKRHYAAKNQPVPLDHLSDESGIDPRELTGRIRELQKAGVAAAKIPLTFLVTKEVKGDALKQYERIRCLEEKILEFLLEFQSNQGYIQVNLRSLASRLDPERTQKTRASDLMDILEGWNADKWIKLIKIYRDIVRIEEVEIFDFIDHHKNIAEAIIGQFYETLEDMKGARLRVGYELDKLINDVNIRIAPVKVSETELKAVLLWMHNRKILRLTDGANLFHQALKVRVFKDRKETRISTEYQKIKAYYEQQTRRTHLMIEYGKIPNEQTRQKLVHNYFILSEKEFGKAFPQFSKKVEEIKRPIIQEDYQRIIGDLNPTQKQIVEAEEPALLVIAGPGSGKTRTIVRRIAYLVKVKRVNPNRILVLAYNRNAVQELRSKLQNLVGAGASQLQVFTFHGLALSLLGCTPGSERLSTDAEFQELLKEACDLIEQGDELEDVDSQARRLHLLGNVEYIFVDEYQDVAEVEYRLIKLVAGLGDSGDESRSVQINLCVIGDDDQNLYGFRGTNPKYISQFEQEYKAKRFLLTENYRSTEAIIEVANKVISNNRQRCKKEATEQVRINEARIGDVGVPVGFYGFENTSSQAAWIADKIQSWLNEGVAANNIAVLSRQWDNLSGIRLLLEKQKIPTYALKSDDIKLGRNFITCRLIEELNAEVSVFGGEDLVRNWFAERFIEWHRNLEEPTVRTLLKIADFLDLERGCAGGNVGLPMTAGEVVMALLEYNKSGVFLEENAILVTSCHGAKGLEFRKVILLTDKFNTGLDQIESERRLFYVAMTRAKEELILCSVEPSLLCKETGLIPQPIVGIDAILPERMLYLNLSPQDVNLGYAFSENQQQIVKSLREGDVIEMKANRYGNNWAIVAEGQEVGTLSRSYNDFLKQRGIVVNEFQFQPGEVRVGKIYNHLKYDPLNGETIENWFVLLPQIRVCR